MSARPEGASDHSPENRSGWSLDGHNRHALQRLAESPSFRVAPMVLLSMANQYWVSAKTRLMRAVA